MTSRLSQKASVEGPYTFAQTRDLMFGALQAMRAMTEIAATRPDVSRHVTAALAQNSVIVDLALVIEMAWQKLDNADIDARCLRFEDFVAAMLNQVDWTRPRDLMQVSDLDELVSAALAQFDAAWAAERDQMLAKAWASAPEDERAGISYAEDLVPYMREVFQWVRSDARADAWDVRDYVLETALPALRGELNASHAALDM